MGGIDFDEKADVWLAKTTIAGKIKGSLILFDSWQWSLRNVDDLRKWRKYM